MVEQRSHTAKGVGSIPTFTTNIAMTNIQAELKHLAALNEQLPMYLLERHISYASSRLKLDFETVKHLLDEYLNEQTNN